MRQVLDNISGVVRLKCRPFGHLTGHRLRTYPNSEQLDTRLRIDGNLSPIFSLHGGVKHGEETESLRLVSA